METGKLNLAEIEEIVECVTFEDANKYLEMGWIMIRDPFLSRQACYILLNIKAGFEKVQAFDKIVRIYVLGRLKK